MLLQDITVRLDLDDQAFVEGKGELGADCHIFAVNGEVWIFGFWVILLENFLLFRCLVILFGLLCRLILICLDSVPLLLLAIGSL